MTELPPRSITNRHSLGNDLYTRDLNEDSSSSGLLDRIDSPRGISRKYRLATTSRSRRGYLLALGLATLFLIGLWSLRTSGSETIHGSTLVPADDGGDIPLGQSRNREGREVFWWEQFPRLHGFYRGRKRVVSSTQSVSEQFEPDELTEPSLVEIHPGVSAAISQCYLDGADEISVPGWSAVNGVPQGMSTPLFGSHEELGLRTDVCYDRLSRFAQYGLDASEDFGGTGKILNGDFGGMQHENSIDWRQIKWSNAQEKCLGKNRDLPHSKKAFVIRTWHQHKYTPLDIIMLRAIISELVLSSGGEYTVHFLIHVQDDKIPIWASEEVYNQTLKASLPAEFEGMGTLWSVAQMRLIYPPPFPDSIINFSGGDVYDAYRSLHFPLQYFASQHPEFEYFWQWEMDIRVTGHYYELLHQITQWSESQPRKFLWERSSEFFIPALYNDSFASFSASVASKTGDSPISGPQLPSTQLLPLPQQNPPADSDEITDLITLNPLFDPSRTRWAFSNDITGYNKGERPPTRAALITASRMSRRLLLLMHQETFRNKHTMFPEMYPASIALHYGLKAVYAPLPVYFDRQWPAEHANEVFNNAPLTPASRAAGMRDNGHGFFHGEGGSVFGPGEHVFRGASYYSNALFAGYLWRRWLGRENRNDEVSWESEGGGGGGRMCLPMMVLHPVKSE